MRRTLASEEREKTVVWPAILVFLLGILLFLLLLFGLSHLKDAYEKAQAEALQNEYEEIKQKCTQMQTLLAQTEKTYEKEKKNLESLKRELEYLSLAKEKAENTLRQDLKTIDEKKSALQVLLHQLKTQHEMEGDKVKKLKAHLRAEKMTEDGILIWERSAQGSPYVLSQGEIEDVAKGLSAFIAEEKSNILFLTIETGGFATDDPQAALSYYTNHSQSFLNKLLAADAFLLENQAIFRVNLPEIPKKQPLSEENVLRLRIGVVFSPDAYTALVEQYLKDETRK